MKMPSKGQRVFVEGYGKPIFIGAMDLNNPVDGKIGLKYENIGLDDGMAEVLSGLIIKSLMRIEFIQSKIQKVKV